MKKEFPEDMVPLENKEFRFSCHSGLQCYTLCCKNVDMYLFPYDILRLKNAVGLDSETFLRKHTHMVKGVNPYFPSLMLKLTDGQNACPFLLSDGCSVYEDRPSSCRTYPLERAVDRDAPRKTRKDYYFLTDHPYCLGHGENCSFTVNEWARNQKIHIFNLMNDLWAELDSIFLMNPWQGEGSGGPKQQLSFMACYNIDGFRKYTQSNDIFGHFRLARELKKEMERNDTELLKFGFEWLKFVLTGKSNLVKK
ncbi:MAG: YkgJ family cysteine cluster protein [Desulfocapsaceae bacterium]|nr:YkgJ family cysteine cluster protein [Desulfocapsaceae bacterium]